MKTILQTLFFFLLVTQICFAQWYQQNSGTAHRLVDVAFSDANNGIAITYFLVSPRVPVNRSELLKTTNGGTNWLIQGCYGPLKSVSYIDTNNCFIVGGDTIFKSTDGGITWTSQTIENTRLNGVYFSDVNTGTVVGYVYDTLSCGIGVIIRTTDGGNTWNYQSSQTELPLNDVCFVDAYNGWIVGSLSPCNSNGEIILNTTDGGITWTEQWSSPENGLVNVCFNDLNNGWAVGPSGTILHTTNGGTIWTEIDETAGDVMGVCFTDVNNGWIVGGGLDSLGYTFSTIFHTDNGGTTWTQLESGTTSILSSVHFIDANTGWAVGDSGTILHTTNGGVSFVEEEQIGEGPTEFLLSQNYPNPFNPSTKIEYSVPQTSQVQIKVFDVLGKKIETLVDEEKPAGEYEVEFNTTSHSSEVRNRPSGIYFYQIKAGNYIETKKMVLLR
jgi:photosystem II stability/assembly factor-like uncharacterized protein